MTAPVYVVADIGDAGDSGDGSCYGGASPCRMRIGVQAFGEKWRQIDQVVGKPKVFLCQLYLQQKGSMGHGAEEGMEWFAGLEVDRAVLDLKQDVRFELTVERFEFIVGLPGPVFIGCAIDKGPPDDDPVVGSQGIGEHIGPVGV